MDGVAHSITSIDVAHGHTHTHTLEHTHQFHQHWQCINKTHDAVTTGITPASNSDTNTSHTHSHTHTHTHTHTLTHTRAHTHTHAHAHGQHTHTYQHHPLSSACQQDANAVTTRCLTVIQTHSRLSRRPVATMSRRSKKIAAILQSDANAYQVRSFRTLVIFAHFRI